MKALVIYDSNYGNTKLLAEAIGRSLGEATPVIAIADVKPEQLRGLDLLVVGSPINGWKPSARTGQWLDGLRDGQLQHVRVATFDTRINIIIHGDAAKHMSKRLVEAGATLAAEPTWFFVNGKEGPLRDGEIARAKAWAQTLLTD